MGIGFLFAVISLWFFRPPFLWTIPFMIPMLLDGILQLKTAYESTNIRRLITGILFAYGIIAFVVVGTIESYHLGQYVKELIS